MAAGLPVVLQDGTNTYVYGLDLISATDGGGDQTYFLYDGLGSTTDLTDDEGDVVDDYTYDVFGAIRSQSGSSDNHWLFTGVFNEGDIVCLYGPSSFVDGYRWWPLRSEGGIEGFAAQADPANLGSPWITPTGNFCG